MYPYSFEMRRQMSLRLLSIIVLSILSLNMIACFTIIQIPLKRSSFDSSECFNGNRVLFRETSTIPLQKLLMKRRSTILDSVSSKHDNEVERELSDVDARVLRAMLQEKKLNLETEDDVRKLLERGTVKTVSKQRIDTMKQEQESSEYSSKVLKTLTDTKLWRKVSAQTSNALESLGIWISNKIEQDVKVVAALGVFAWDRVTRDVARALPAASSAAKKQLFALSNSSSYVAAVIRQNATMINEQQNFVQELNRPEDEIKSVSRELFAILSGERTSYSPKNNPSIGRGLRTVAPAGSSNSAERQRRALQQRRKLDAAKKNIANIGGNVIDTTWELRRELKAESNVPGYKTEPIRNAIAAGVSATGNLLNGVREKAFLAAAQNKKSLNPIREMKAEETETNFVLSANNDNETNFVETKKSNEKSHVLLDKIRNERKRIMDRLTLCIDNPNDTWLTTEITNKLTSLDIISGIGMQDTLTKMILLRDEIANPSHDEIFSSLDNSVDDLIGIRTAIEYLCSVTASEVSEYVSAEIQYQLLGRNENDDNIEPFILRIEDELEIYRIQDDELDIMNKVTDKKENQILSNEISHENSQEIFDVIPDAIFIDVIPDAFMMDTQEIVDNSNTIDGVSAGLVAEIVSEDDFENAVGEAKTVFAVQKDEKDFETDRPNLAILVLLRSLDVIFFITEKVFTVGVPGTILLVKTALTRLDDVNRCGLGAKGWKELVNVADGSGRY